MRSDVVPIGLFRRNPAAERYDLDSAAGVGLEPAERIAAVRAEIDRFLIRPSAEGAERLRLAR